jgi:hypothetical protein
MAAVEPQSSAIAAVAAIARRLPPSPPLSRCLPPSQLLPPSSAIAAIAAVAAVCRHRPPSPAIACGLLRPSLPLPPSAAGAAECGNPLPQLWPPGRR